MEDMPTIQLLIEPCSHHLFSAYDTDAITACQVIHRGIWEAVHASRDLAKSQKVGDAIAEVAECHVEVPDLRQFVRQQQHKQQKDKVGDRVSGNRKSEK